MTLLKLRSLFRWVTRSVLRLPRPAGRGRLPAPAGGDCCRKDPLKTRPEFADIAGRVQPAGRWDDLVLPAPQKKLLQQVAASVRRRADLRDTGEFAPDRRRDRGVSVLFAGDSGTGKTMAAEALATELRLDLYRIDLGRITSRYIEDTEKHLRRVLGAAEERGAILLLEEADALFGKRSEVKDSHHRYANIQVSYLLQRIEACNGLVILTTNQKDIDAALLRRADHVVEFPMPDAALRTEFWQRILPPKTAADDPDPRLLATLELSGGSIHKVAVSAASIAAGLSQPVRMPHLLQAARTECARLGRPLTDEAVAGWM